MAAAAEAEKAEAAAPVRQKSEILEQQKAAAARAEEDAAEAEAARQVKRTRTRRHVTPYLTPHIPHIYSMAQQEAMEEEEALRERVLAELTAKGKQFRRDE